MRKITTIIIGLTLMLTLGCTVAFANTDVESECEHYFYEYTEQEQTCEDNGIVNYVCMKCDYTETVNTPATGHDFGSWYYESEWDRPDCEYEGEMTRACQNAGCYEVRYKTVPATGHDFGSWYYESEWDRPGCIYEGYKARRCQNENCGEYEYKEIPALGHKYKKVLKKARPYKAGYTKSVCSRCDYSKNYSKIYAPNKVKLSATKLVYNGKVRKPTVKVYNGAGNVIKASHYKVSYQKGRKNVGKYKVTITFKNSSTKYAGKMTKSFTIRPKATSITKLTKGVGSFTVKWKKVSKQITGYQIKYSEYSDMSDATYKTIKSTKTISKKISKLSQGEKYYVQVRTYKVVNGNKYYSSWSKKKSITTKERKSSSSSSSSSSDDDDDYVGSIYITRTGECYHARACGNGTYYLSTLSEALALGLRPCQKCF